MIVTEAFTEGGRNLVKTYSDAGMIIEQNGTGHRYPEAIDPADSGRTYTETDEPIEQGDEEEGTAEEVINILLGGAE